MGRGLRCWAWLPLLLLLAGQPGLHVVRHGLPSLDDPDTPRLLQAIDRHGGLAGSGHWLTHDWPLETHLYRPVTVVSLAADRALWGDWLPGYRLTAWVLILGVAGLAAWLTVALTGSQLAGAVAVVLLTAQCWAGLPTPFLKAPQLALPALFIGGIAWWESSYWRRQGKPRAAALWRAPVYLAAAAFVAFHADRYPLETLPGWIAARTAVLGTLFGTLTLVCLYGYGRRPRRRSLSLALLCCALALGAYEQAVVLPAIGTLWLVLLHRAGWRTGLRAAVGLWGVLAAYLVVRWQVFGLAPSPYHEMQVSVTWKEPFEWAAYCLRPVQEAILWRSLQGHWYDLAYPQLHLSLVVILAYALVLGLLRESWRPALLLFGWKAIAFAPMAFLPPYPHYYFFSEVGSCMLGGLVVARAVAQAGLAPVRPPGQAR
ncbi:MAG: hypothetical protein GX774_05050 [Armatimonadetes bacterium]|nr:hypothetical protein [Armatimonadota bacterium]